MIKENILVSHNQIIVRSIPFNNDIQKWTEETLERGILWNKNYVILDPLVDESFGSWFFIEEKIYYYLVKILLGLPLFLLR